MRAPIFVLRDVTFSAILHGVEEREPESEVEGKQPPKAAPFSKGDLPNFSAWQMAWELGYTIAIPIVIFALLGRWADKAWGTNPWLLLAGIVVSIMISSFAVYRKMKDILRD